MHLTTVQKILLAVALAAGAALLWWDTHAPNDDSGTVGAAVFGASVVLGFLSPARPYLWALAVGSWIPLWAVVHTHNYWAVLALGFAFAGAYFGKVLRTTLLP